MAFYDIIEGSYNLMRDYADEAFRSAIDFLNQMEGLAVTLDIPDVTYIWKPLPVIPGMKIAVPPSDIVVVPNFPGPPSSFVPTPIAPPAISSPPVYGVVKPSIVFPNRPNPIVIGTAPVVPTVDTSVTYPTAPSYTFPSVPTLDSITLPTLDPLVYPTFSAIPPDDTFVAIPGNIFSFTEEDYGSTLFDSIVAALQDRVVNGGTGLNPVVEQAIWDRERNREDQAMLKAKEEIRAEFASRGHSLPPGVEYQKLLEVAVETQNKIVSFGRDIAIKQADLEQENVKHAITETVRLESTLIANWNSIMQRKFEVAKYTQEVAINIFEAQLSLYNARVAAYNIEVQVYNTIVQTELVKVQAYAAEVDAQKLINDINKTTVQIYSEQINAIGVLVSTYKTELEAVAIRLSAEKTKIDIYLGEMQGYIAEIEANKVEFETYKVAVDAETSKIEGYTADINAFAARVGAYSTEVGALVDSNRAEIDTERLRLDSYTNDLEAYKTQVQAETVRIKSKTDTYSELVRAYATKTDAFSTEFTSGLAVYDAAIKENIARVEVELKQADINITKVIEENKLLIETTKAGGLLSSELASAALTAINVSAEMGLGITDNTSRDYNYTGETWPAPG